MKAYECLFIVHPGADSSELEQSAAKLGDLIAEKGGEVRQVDQWGKRKLAYPIQKLTDGNFILMRFDAEPATIAELEFRLRVDDRVLRYMTSYEVPEGTGRNDELMQLTERKERDRRGRGRGRGGRFGGRGGGPGGGRGGFRDRDDRGPRPDRPQQASEGGAPAGDRPAAAAPAERTRSEGGDE